MIEVNKIYHLDSLVGMREMVEQGLKVDLILTDPPYDIPNTKAGGHSPLSKSIQGAFDELSEGNLTKGITREFLEVMVQLQGRINIYIWCNGKQIPFYLDFFVGEHKCKYDILIWNKTNAMPTFCNKYLTDKEYVLYFRKGGYCNPSCYEDAKTVYYAPINAKDKKKYGHPTIKPLDFVMRMIRNSSHEGDLILDPFAGSGTIPLAAKLQNRNYIGFEIEERFFLVCQERLSEVRLC